MGKDGRLFAIQADSPLRWVRTDGRLMIMDPRIDRYDCLPVGSAGAYDFPLDLPPAERLATGPSKWLQETMEQLFDSLACIAGEMPELHPALNGLPLDHQRITSQYQIELGPIERDHRGVVVTHLQLEPPDQGIARQYDRIDVLIDTSVQRCSAMKLTAAHDETVYIFHFPGDVNYHSVALPPEEALRKEKWRTVDGRPMTPMTPPDHEQPEPQAGSPAEPRRRTDLLAEARSALALVPAAASVTLDPHADSWVLRGQVTSTAEAAELLGLTRSLRRPARVLTVHSELEIVAAQ